MGREMVVGKIHVGQPPRRSGRAKLKGFPVAHRNLTNHLAVHNSPFITLQGIVVWAKFESLSEDSNRDAFNFEAAFSATNRWRRFGLFGRLAVRSFFSRWGPQRQG